jgi:hypothetical protein
MGTQSGGLDILQSIASLWRRRELCDVSVQAGGGSTFPAHRVILAAGSSFVRALLTGECPQRRVQPGAASRAVTSEGHDPPVRPLVVQAPART